jgi:hypothetical protein
MFCKAFFTIQMNDISRLLFSHKYRSINKFWKKNYNYSFHHLNAKHKNNFPRCLPALSISSAVCQIWSRLRILFTLANIYPFFVSHYLCWADNRQFKFSWSDFFINFVKLLPLDREGFSSRVTQWFGIFWPWQIWLAIFSKRASIQ